MPISESVPLRLRALLAGRRLLVFGGTGFLGKVWLALLLDRFPELEHVFLLVRPRADQSPEERLQRTILTSEVFDPLRARLGAQFDAYVAARVTPVAGDVSQAMCGLDAGLREALRGRIDAVVNVAGVVDFSPPLDEALEVNTLGVRHLVELARSLGDVPVFHTSTCYVAGQRTGAVGEEDPRAFPFPRAGELDRSHWDVEREIRECQQLVAQVRARSGDAFRESRFLAEAKEALEARHEPTSGHVLQEELARVRRRFTSRQLSDVGTERAAFWGWPNIYTYTKSLGEQVLVHSGLRFTLARPAIIESSLSYPVPGWNEGINTTSPVIYVGMKGLTHLPSGPHTVMDIVPVDLVASGMILSLAALLEGTQAPVYQYGTSDSNPLELARIVELSGLFKRRYWARRHELQAFVQRRFETVTVDVDTYRRVGAPAQAMAAKGLSSALRAASRLPGAGALGPVARAIGQAGRGLDKTARVLDVFLPFITNSYRYSCANTRALRDRLGPEDRALVDWAPERIDWRHYWLEVHAPGVVNRIFPEIERQRAPRPARSWDTLPELLAGMAERHGHACALAQVGPDGLTRVSFLEWHERARALTDGLARAGVRPGDLVLLARRGSPEWAIRLFGIVGAGATALVVDDGASLETLAQAHGARLCETALAPEPRAPAPHVDPDSAALAFLAPDGGLETFAHREVTDLVAALARELALTPNDRLLGLRPAHDRLALAAGLLAPMSCGTRVVFPADRRAGSFAEAIASARITTVVGGTDDWDALEKALIARAGTGAARGLDLQRELRRVAGLDVGKLVLAPMHAQLGGALRRTVSLAGEKPPRRSAFTAMGVRAVEIATSSEWFGDRASPHADAPRALAAKGS